MISTFNREWAAQLVEAGATLDTVNRELICCGIQASSPEDAKAVREEFIRLTLENTELARRGREQFENWK
mgnify:FL=1